jgi:hypothetical protein
MSPKTKVEKKMIAAAKLTVMDGIEHRVSYDLEPEGGMGPWDPDAERYLKSGQCFRRLTYDGFPQLYERVLLTAARARKLGLIC